LHHFSPRRLLSSAGLLNITSSARATADSEAAALEQGVALPDGAASAVRRRKAGAASAYLHEH
jgi:hypothetical protein